MTLRKRKEWNGTAGEMGGWRSELVVALMAGEGGPFRGLSHASRRKDAYPASAQGETTHSRSHGLSCLIFSSLAVSTRKAASPARADADADEEEEEDDDDEDEGAATRVAMMGRSRDSGGETDAAGCGVR